MEDDLLIMKSDKGNATVLLDRAVYDNKMMDLLGGEDYAKLRKKIQPQNLRKESKTIYLKSKETEKCLLHYGRNYLHSIPNPHRSMVCRKFTKTIPLSAL